MCSVQPLPWLTNHLPSGLPEALLEPFRSRIRSGPRNTSLRQGNRNCDAGSAGACAPNAVHVARKATTTRLPRCERSIHLPRRQGQEKICIPLVSRGLPGTPGSTLSPAGTLREAPEPLFRGASWSPEFPLRPPPGRAMPRGRGDSSGMRARPTESHRRRTSGSQALLRPVPARPPRSRAGPEPQPVHRHRNRPRAVGRVRHRVRFPRGPHASPHARPSPRPWRSAR